MEPTTNIDPTTADELGELSAQSVYAFPMSFAQQRLWFLNQFEPQSTLYNIVWPIRLHGRLNVEALEKSLNEIVRRHEVLRATFKTINDQPVQVIAPSVIIPLAIKNLTNLSQDQQQQEVQRLIAAEAETPIKLQTGPMIRAQLAFLADEEHAFLLTLHHIVSDRWSRGIFFRELGVLYEAFSQGHRSLLPELPLQYTDFSVWQRQWLNGENLEKQLSYWKQQLAGAPATLELPTDHPRPATRSFHGRVYSFQLASDLVDELKALSRREGVTLFMLLLAGLQTLLARYSGQEDIVVGTPIANRNRAEIENLIGFFANTLPLRTNFSDNPTFRELLGRVRDLTLGAYAHQDLPFEKLVEELNPERNPSHNPIVQVLFALQNAPTQDLRLAGLTVKSIATQSEGSKFDLSLFLTEAHNAIQARLEYNTDLFQESTAARMMAHFQTLLREVVANPEKRISEYELLTDTERHHILVDWNDTAADFPAVGIHDLFQTQTSKSPDSVAVRFGNLSMTYAELNHRSNQLANYLRGRGVGTETLIGLYIDRSLDMMVALLGILKAGAAYVPLDPAYPTERIAFIVEDSGVSVLITQERLTNSLPAHAATVVAIDKEWNEIAKESAANLSLDITPENLAYVLYTSGSTGKPKGVQIEHRAVVNFLTAMRQQPGLTGRDILLAVTTLSFDIAGLELYLPLVCGAQVVLANREQAANGKELLRLMQETQATAMQATPATWRLLLDSGWAGNPTLKALCGGEALPRDLAEQLRPLCGELWNMYGPTETTIWSSVHSVDEIKWAVAPIGRPIANTQMYVLDNALRPVPVGIAGELYIGGDGLARGYWQRPELTAEKFIDNPFKAGTRLYRTGDLARFLADGTLHYLGRTDNQVKVRGFRIELGEIESVIARHQAVEQAVVIAREDAHGDKRLIAFFIPITEKHFTLEDLRKHAKQSLPEYMVPSAFVALKEFPLTPNGKIDRRALLSADEISLELTRLKVPPRNALEEAVAGIWSDILAVENVGAHDDFFDLGGHSLLATRVISRLQQAFQVEIPLRALFEGPTVAELAERIQRAQQVERGPQASPMVAVSRQGNLPLSFAQQRLWFLDQLEPDNPLYNVPWAFRLTGALQVEALEKSLNEIVRRHEVLRTSFRTEDNVPVQVIAPRLQIELAVTELSSLSESERDIEARRLVFEEGARPFHLQRGPLLRAALLRLGAEDHILVVNLHHIVSDRWSVGVLTQELITLYQVFVEGKPSPLPELGLQYGDFAVWQRQWLQGEVLEQQMAYWRRQLEGAPPVLEIPTDRPRPPKESFRGDVKAIPISAAATEKLKELSRGEGVTLFMTLLAAWQVLLSRYSGQEDIVVGIPIANRNRGEIEGLIGFFANTLALRGDLSGNPSFRELLERVREVALSAYAHQDLPFEKLVEELRPERSLSHNPLFQVLFALQNTPALDQEIPGLKLQAMGAKVGTAKCDLALFMAEGPQGLMGRLEYNTDIFDASTIDRLANHLQILLQGIVADAEQPIFDLPLLDRSERDQLLVKWNDTAADYPRSQCLHQQFETQVERTPDAIAVCCEDQSLTYRELNKQANRLAHYLQKRGIGPGHLIGIYLERSLAMMVALLAVQKSGAAYIPIDPAYPADRIGFMLEDAQAPLLLTEKSLLDSVPRHGGEALCLDSDAARWAEESVANPTSQVTPEDLVYVIFTSGSTGRPKGVQVRHRAVVNLLSCMARELSMGEHDVVPALASFAFDMCIPELYLALISGGRVVIGQRHLAANGEELAALLRKTGATLVHATPTTWSLLLEAGFSGQGLKRVIGAEPLSRELCTRLLEADPSLYNFYGPTETTVWSTFHQFRSPDEPLTVGKPLANTQVYILDKNLRSVPVGVPGEIHIGGDGVACGYLKRPELTAEKFIADSFSNKPHAQLYKTGDLARYFPDGRIEFLGRIDNQVKLRGYRIELGEIEAVLSKHPSLQAAAVVIREDKPGDKRLVAYMVPANGGSVDNRELRSAIKAQLPDYMVPSAFVVLETLPLNPNGKVDRKALKAPETSHIEVEGAHVAPRTPVEEAVAGIWSEVLRVNQVGAHDDFFALGGHSLLATQVMSRVRRVFQVEIPLRALFEGPTVAELAERIQRAQQVERGPQAAPMVAVSRQGNLPLSFAQQRLWFLDQLEPDNPLYNVPWAFRLTGALQVEALEKSLNEIVRRHEVLRTTFRTEDNVPVQVIAPSLQIELAVTELSDMPESERDIEARRLVFEEGARPFHLQRGPLLRAALLRLGAEDHILVVNLHHIVSDRWSVGVLTQELITLYQVFVEGKPSPLPELGLQYGDFAVWQRQWLQGEVLEQQMAYWRRQLEGAPPVLEIPTDRPRPPKESFRGDIKAIPISSVVTEKLKELSRGEGVTLFMTLLAAWQVLLSRYSGQEDIVVGIPIANRNRGEIEGLIGFFANTLALRGDLSGNPSFRELLERVREVALSAYAHQDLPFEKLVEELRPERSLSHNPLFQVLFALQNTPALDQEIPGLKLQAMGAKGGTAKCDLALFMAEGPQGLMGRLEYNTDIFDASTIDRLANHFQILLQGVVADAEQRIFDLPLLDRAERDQLLVKWNATAADYPRSQCLHQQFEAQVQRTPDAAAVSFEDRSLSYRELNKQANRLAHYLQKRGVGPGHLIGIYLERSLAMMVALLAVQKSGAAYVPIDPAYPADRIGFMLEDAQAPLLLTEKSLLDSVPRHGGEALCLDGDAARWAEESASNPSSQVTPEDLVYVIFTSGSTGRPKGVQVRHRAVVNLLSCMARELNMGEHDVVPALASFAFDMCIPELYLALISGGRVVIGQRHLAANGEELAALLRNTGATLVHATPTTWSLLLEAGFSGQGLKRVIGAEPLSRELCTRLLEADPSLYNFYGPTETTVWSTFHQFRSPDEPLTVGKPLANTQVYILDKNLRPVPMGVPGEIHIGGDGVACGYLKRPELTAEKFIADPFSNQPHAQLYKTGDLARYFSDGRIEFLGRIDNQVKLRGYRIELGEIEAVLCKHPSLQAAAVVIREDKPGDKRLVAYVIPVAGQDPSASELRAHLRRHLPEYMVPSAFTALDKFPLTPNGKLDRHALPVRDMPLQNEVIAPRDEVESMLIEIWEKLLNIQSIGVQDNFFELGGHSLLAVRLMTEIQKATGKLIPLATLFQGATVEHLAEVLRGEALPAHQMVTMIQPGDSKPPFFAVATPGVNPLGYVALARHLAEDQPFYSIQGAVPRLKGRPYSSEEFENLANQYVDAMKKVQPLGPYYLGGMCGGARIAFEMARILERLGEEVALLAIFDTWVIENSQIRFLWQIDYYSGRLKTFWRVSLPEKREMIRKWWQERMNQRESRSNGSRGAWLEAYWPGPSFVPHKFGGNITVIKRPKQPYYYVNDPLMGWGTRTTAKVELQLLDVKTSQHILLLREPYVRHLAEKLDNSLRRSRARESDLKTGTAAVQRAAASCHAIGSASLTE